MTISGSFLAVAATREPRRTPRSASAAAAASTARSSAAKLIASAARVWLDYRSDGLSLVIDDDGGAHGNGARPDGGGHGIAGMRERVNAVEGQLRAGPRAGGGYRVFATLPTQLRGTA